jgi:predicted metallopeptidase
VSTIEPRTDRPPLPLVYRWGAGGEPLPVRAVQSPPAARPVTLGLEAPPWWPSGPVDQPFDFCGHIASLCADIVRRCPELRHIDVGRLLFDVTQARSDRRHGLQARVTPLRCRGGALTRVRGGVRYQVQRYVVDGRDLLYLVTFCLPRFLNQTFDEKLITLFHELYHISPAFEGDLRRHEGRYSLHSRSQQEYDGHMTHLARAYRAGGGDDGLVAFLRLNFAQLRHRHGRVVGVRVPRPRLIPVGEPQE